MAGLVSVKENFEGVRMFGPGMVIPEYRTGDLTSSGRTVVEILDVERMEILMRVPESERSILQPGQRVDVQLDALPGRTYAGKVKTVSGMVSGGGMFFRNAGPSRNFDVIIEMERFDERMRPGVTVQVVVQGDQVQNALLLPRQAVFEKDGKSVVYLRHGESFTAQQIQIKSRTESQVAVEGVKEGDEVSLVNPEAKSKQPPGKAPTPGGPNVRVGAGR
jgi:multidrug efflux pump subunit AcrA (membrane-fusion protein)